MTDDPSNDRTDSPMRKGRRAGGTRRRILRSTAVLPGVFTISNGLFGFAAIHFATKGAETFDATLSNQTIACWLVFAAMFCDMIDGRVARLTRRTSDFGGQLDSMCDIISFGVAPAMVMLRTSSLALGQVSLVAGNRILERSVWCVAAAYVACAALRLARFNVENEPDESAHMSFQGLPSPGAAAAVVAPILLFENLGSTTRGGWLSSSWLKTEWFCGQWGLLVTSVVLTGVTLGVALFMVSRFPYIHPINQYTRGKRSFGYLVKFLAVMLAMIIEPMLTLAVATVTFALSGPVAAIRRSARSPKANAPAGGPQDTP